MGQGFDVRGDLRVNIIKGIWGLLVLTGSIASASDINWSGKYRAEGVFIKNPSLDKNQNYEQSYLLHHLILEPKIIAADGLNIKGRFDILNNALGNNQIGQLFGNYTGNSSTSSASPSATLT